MQTKHDRSGGIMGFGIAVFGLSMWALPIQAGTVGYWRFETDGGAAVTNGQLMASADDSSGNGYSLTPVYINDSSRPRYATNDSGVFPNKIPRTGGANGFYQGTAYAWMTNADFTLSGDGTFTVEGYCRITAADGGLYRALVGSEMSGPNGFVLALGGSVGGKSQFQVIHQGWGAVTTTNADVTFGTTHHFAYVQSNNVTRIYLDGVLLETRGYPEGVIGTSWTGISVGSQYDAAILFPGYIDEIRISNDALEPKDFLNKPPVATIITLR